MDTRVTAADGTYNFSPLVTGNYIVVLTPPAGSEGATTLEREVAVPSGQTVVTTDFALPPEDGKTRALVFLDQDFDGEPGVNERLSDVTVVRRFSACGSLTNATTDEAQTNSDGLAVFDATIHRSTCLYPDPDTLPAGVDLASPLGTSISRSGFAFIRLLPAGVLTVQPFWDMNGDLNWGANEPLVGGADVSIPGEGTVRSNATTGANFNLSAGSYAVTVTPSNNMGVPIIQPQIATVNNGSASSLAIPMHYLGQIDGTLQANGGTPPWANVTIVLENLDSGAVQTASVATSSGYFTFSNATPGTYRLRLQSNPPGWALASQPVFYYAAGNTVSQALSLVRLGSLTGLVYTDANGNGVKNGNESVNGNYDVTLVNNAGLSEQIVNVAADGTFAINNLLPGVQYAVTLDLGGGQFGAPGVAITENPGWFTVGSAGLNVRIGLFPYPWSNDNGGDYNTVYGRIYEQVGTVKNPHAGAVIGYRRWNDNGGCQNNNPILGTTTSDVDGYYRLLTDFIPSTWEFFCIELLELPGMAQSVTDIVTSSAFYYQSTNGMVYYPGVDQRDVVVSSVGTFIQSATAVNEIHWLAFRDDNGNGVRDGLEPALPGATLQTGTSQAISGLDGSGTLTDLPAGQQILTITPPTGYAAIGPTTQVVWLNDAPLSLGQIGFRPTGWLVGSLFVDDDGDGWRAPDESGLGGVTLTLAGPVVTSTATTPDGSFAVQGLSDGIYAVTVDAPDGFVALPGMSVGLVNGGTLSLGLQPSGHISGAVYEDWDGDGQRLPDEPLLAFPVTMTLGTEISSLQAGKFLFWNVASGNYPLAPQYAAAEAAMVSPQNGGGVALASVPAGIVRGTLWMDENSDGLRQSWEVPLSGVVITLDNSVATTTDERGCFRFLGVTDSSHNLDVTLPERLQVNIPSFTTGEGRGTAIGIAVSTQTENIIYLPLVKR